MKRHACRDRPGAISRQDDKNLWKVPSTQQNQIEAIAIAGNAVLLAGRVKPARAPSAPADGLRPGFVWVLSANAGDRAAELRSTPCRPTTASPSPGDGRTCRYATGRCSASGRQSEAPETRDPRAFLGSSPDWRS